MSKMESAIHVGIGERHKVLVGVIELIPHLVLGGGIHIEHTFCLPATLDLLLNLTECITLGKLCVGGF